MRWRRRRWPPPMWRPRRSRRGYADGIGHREGAAVGDTPHERCHQLGQALGAAVSEHPPWRECELVGAMLDLPSRAAAGVGHEVIFVEPASLPQASGRVGPILVGPSPVRLQDLTAEDAGGDLADM